MRGVTVENVKDVFSYHAPEAGQLEKYRILRESAAEFAKTILECVPPCADQQTAIRKVREAVMTANAAIALKGSI